MKYLLATAAVLALTGVSATGAERYQPDDTTLEVLPPPEYDKPFAGKLEEFIAKDQKELTSFCRGLSESVIGCARHWPASESGPPLCDIYLAPDELIRRRGLPPKLYAAMRSRIAMVGIIRRFIDPWSLKVSKP